MTNLQIECSIDMYVDLLQSRPLKGSILHVPSFYYHEIYEVCYLVFPARIGLSGPLELPHTTHVFFYR